MLDLSWVKVEQSMGLLITNHLPHQGLLLGINVKNTFRRFPRVPSVLGMVASRLASHYILTRSILYLLSRCQVFHQTTLQISVTMLAIQYVVSLLNIETKFP